MIADELNRALRNEERWAEKSFCPREAQFHELYQALGNKSRQDEIREEAERRSCYILLRNPGACEALPERIGDIEAGQPCPNNPFQREAKLLAELISQRPLLEIAMYVDDLARMCAIDPDRATPEEWTIMRIMAQRSEHRRLQAAQSGMMRVVHLRPGQEER